MAFSHENISATSTPIWNVPYPRNPFLSGREELLDQLHAGLQSSTSTYFQAIIGDGGVGKTALAVEYSYRHASDYRAILWAHASSQSIIISEFVALARLLELPEQHEKDHIAILAAVRRWLHDEQGWLLIFDNVADLQMLNDFLPDTSQGHILLTTRAKLSDASSVQSYEVGPLAHDESILLLLRYAQRIQSQAQLDGVSTEEETQARKITRLLEGLPQAIEQAGMYITNTKCSLLSYYIRYRQRYSDLLKQRSGLLSAHEEPLITTWSLAFEEIGPSASDLLRFCTFLSLEMITQEMIIEAAPDLGPSVLSIASSYKDIDETIHELRRLALLQIQSDRHSCSISRLGQSVLKELLSEDEQRRWAEQTVRAVTRILAITMTTGEHEQYILSHALVSAALIKQYHFLFPEAAQLLDQLGLYMHQHLRKSEAEPFYQYALSIWQQSVGDAHPGTLATMHHLAHLYNTQSRFEQAEPLYQQVIELGEQVYGTKNAEYALVLTDLADLYCAKEQYERAEPLYKQALAIYEEVLLPEHSELSMALNSLAWLYHSLGRYAEAEPLYHRALTIYEHTREPNHPDVALCLNNLADLYQKMGDYIQAEPLYQRALAIREELLGSDHPDTANSLTHLAALYIAQQDYEQAQPLLQHALVIRERSLGSEHTDVAATLYYLATLYRTQELYEQAEPYLQRALHIYQNRLGELHPNTATCLYHLAELQHAQEHYELAEQFYRRSLAISEQLLGEHHPNVIAILERYALLLRTMQHGEEAAVLEERIQLIYSPRTG